MDSFEKSLMDAIVAQFFVGVEYRTDYGTQRQEPMAATLAKTVIRGHMDELAKAVGKKMDVDVIATEVAEKLAERLSGSTYESESYRKQLHQAIIDKYAQLKAQQMIDAEKA
jgi:hypothetical protein